MESNSNTKKSLSPLVRAERHALRASESKLGNVTTRLQETPQLNWVANLTVPVPICS